MTTSDPAWQDYRAGVPEARPEIFPAAAATTAAEMLRGELRAGQVLAVFGTALLVGVPTASGERQLTLLTGTASGVPTGVRLPSTVHPDRLQRFRQGDGVTAGGGSLRLDGLEAYLVREWDSSVRPMAPLDGAVPEFALSVRGREVGVPAAAVMPLRESLDHPEDLGRSVFGLLGLGSGLTPGGDDVLAGTAVGLLAADRRDLLELLGQACRPQLHRTTPMSAELLRLALLGHACTEVLGVLTSLRTGKGLTRSTATLFGVGHTSGTDLATGLVIGLSMR